MLRFLFEMENIKIEILLDKKFTEYGKRLYETVNVKFYMNKC